jgi:phenylpropionate dioxygenase-like ring-hydroxylating dioxygenase large terminal subunit
VRLLREDQPCAKAFVCPYHGWTYGLDGSLRHIPHEDAFPSCQRSERGLVAVRVEERHGLVWGSLDDSAPNVRTHLASLDEELAGLDLGAYAVGERVVSEHRGNWKLLMEGFLESYHVRPLHRASVYPFFLDARSVAERVGPHVRAATARRAAREVGDDASFAARSLLDLATPNYSIFPCTTLILHPDWVSLVVVQPLATDRLLWQHTQLLPPGATTDAARAHFARSFALIQGGVFESEDLLMVAEIQAGLETGANTSVTFGLLESPALWFHAAIDEALEQPGQS